jgi:hypothetical protein
LLIKSRIVERTQIFVHFLVWVSLNLRFCHILMSIKENYFEIFVKTI